ncbi:hypothetical protein JHK87_053087 [Glycine soja]|nr:hypothetical protein JHK87_053087 [Glycine soja]
MAKSLFYMVPDWEKYIGLAYGFQNDATHAGVVQGWTAILMGVISGSIPWYTMMILHDKLPFLKQIDDPMAVFHTYDVAGALGDTHERDTQGKSSFPASSLSSTSSSLEILD